MRAPTTTAIVVFSLALGTGENAAVYGVLDALLFRAPAGIASAGRLVTIYTSEFSGQPYGPSSYPDFEAVQSATGWFDAVAAVDDSAVDNLRLGNRVRACASPPCRSSSSRPWDCARTLVNW